MIHGMDTGFLVAAEVAEHPQHDSARAMIYTLLNRGDRVAIAPQVLAEFVHVVTDSRRFREPLEVNEARRIARRWWTANEVSHVFPNAAAVQQFLDWLDHLRLGRKRLLDTLLAATYYHGTVTSLLTTNAEDFSVFGCFHIIMPNHSAAGK
jgi:predicted nucleic acid-binding protein